MNGRYKTVTTIRVRFSQDELDFIKIAVAESRCKTSTSFVRNLLNEATRDNATLDDNQLKLILSEDLKIDSLVTSSIREIGRFINNTNKAFSLNRVRSISDQLNTNLEDKIEDLNLIINNEITKISLSNNVVLKQNIDSQKNGNLVKEMNPSFDYYQLDMIKDLHAMSEMKSLSNFMRVLILSLLKNKHYIFNSENSETEELRYQLSQINKNLIQSQNKEYISAKNIQLIQECQISISRLTLLSKSSKSYTVLKKTDSSNSAFKQLLNSVAA